MNPPFLAVTESKKKKVMKSLYLILLFLHFIPLVLSMRAYVYDTETKEDQRAPHDTGLEKSEADLAEFGVLYWKVKGDGLDRTEEIARKRGYNHRQTVSVKI